MGSQLVAFALVAEEFERTGDPILGLKPLFAPLLHGKSGQAFDHSSFADDFTSLYGLQMTAFVARALAERLVVIGLLTRAYDSAHGEQFWVANFDWAQEPIQEHQIEKTIQLFVAWASRQANATDFKFSESQLEAAILSRLSRPEFASIFSRAEESRQPRLKGMLGLAALDVTAKEDAFLDFLVAQFLLEAAQKAPDIFAAVSKISYGSLIADAVTGLAIHTTSKTNASTDLVAVLDGPLVLDVLDLNSKEHKLYAEGFLDALREAKIKLAVFEHSLEEMKLTIDATLASDARGEGFGPMAHRFHTETGQRSYAALVRDSLRNRIEALGLVVLNADHYKSKAYEKFFSDERIDAIRNSIGDLHEHVEARIRDAESIGAVARLKGTKARASSVLEAGAIFVTRNSVLCKRVLKTLARGFSEPTPKFTVATDGQLAGVLWFAKGMHGLSLSRKRLIANCSAAILPRRDVINKIASFVENMRPELQETFEAMMTDSRASLCTMRLTGGDADSIDAAKAMQIVESMRLELAAPAMERAASAEIESALIREEAARISAESKHAVAVLQENIEGLETKLAIDSQEFDFRVAQFELDLAGASSQVEELKAREAQRIASLSFDIERYEERLSQVTERVFRLVEILLALIPIAAAFTSAWGNDSNIQLKIFGLIASIVTVGLVEAFLKKGIKGLIRWCFRGDVKYIEGLKAARATSQA